MADSNVDEHSEDLDESSEESSPASERAPSSSLRKAEGERSPATSKSGKSKKSAVKKEKKSDVPEGTTTYLDLKFNVAAALCYLPIVCFAPAGLWLKTEPTDNKYLRFHAMQGLLVFGVFMAVSVVAGTVENIFYALPMIGTALGFVFSLFRIVIFFGYAGLSMMLVMAVYKGKTKKLPVIGNLAERFLNPPS